MLSLRGHHLVCLHFFTGEGYDRDFTRSLRNILTRADREEIRIASGADDVCTSCPNLRLGRCEYRANAEPDIREMDRKALALLNLSVSGGGRRWDELRDSVRAIFPEWHSLFCSACDWRRACAKNVFFRELSKSKENSTEGGRA